MAHYFFDFITDGKLDSDEEGMVLPNLNAARLEAWGTLANVARDTIRKGSFSNSIISVRTVDGPAFDTAFQWSSTDAVRDG